MTARGADGHRYFEEMAVSHVLGGLDESEGRVFRSHLLECGACKAKVGELRAIAHDLADVERDERRVRTAKAVDTKRRDADEDHDDEPEDRRSQQLSRIALLVGVGVIMLLSGWNFMLRGEIARGQSRGQDEREAAALAQFASQAEVRHQAEGIRAAVGYEGNKLGILLQGVTPSQAYAAYLLDESGNVLERRSVTATARQLPWLLPLARGTNRVVVTRPESQSAPELSGTRVLEAALRQQP
jgi:hypothetical protein